MQTPYSTFFREVGLRVYLESWVYSVRLISMRISEILCCKSPFFEKVGGQSNNLSEKTVSTITLYIGKQSKFRCLEQGGVECPPPLPLIEWGTVHRFFSCCPLPFFGHRYSMVSLQIPNTKSVSRFLLPRGSIF